MHQVNQQKEFFQLHTIHYDAYCRKLKFYTSRTALGAIGTVACNCREREKNSLCNGRSNYIKTESGKKTVKFISFFRNCRSRALFMMTSELISLCSTLSYFLARSLSKIFICAFPFRFPHSLQPSAENSPRRRRSLTQ